MKTRLLLLAALTLASCSHSQTKPSSEAVSHPNQAFQSTDPNQVTIAVVGINDFHGHLLPTERKLPDGTVVKSGGAGALGGMIKRLKEEMNGRVLIVDAGDEWQGTIESNQVKGATVVEFFNRLGVQVAAIGNHEFDFSVPEMQKRFKEAKYPYVASNIYWKKNKKKRVHWDNVYPSRLVTVDGIKVGVIGVSTQQTPGTTRYEFVKDYEFRNAAKPVEEQSGKLKKEGASLVLVTAHAGTVCKDELGLKTWNLWAEDAPQSKCDSSQEIYKLAEDLPAGTINGIISGHTHQVIHHFINHLPVIQDESYNQFFNVIYYTFDRATGKVIPALTKIEGLIPICDQVFEGTDHCDSRRLPKTESPNRVQASFHGKPLTHDESIDAWLKPIETDTEKYRKEVLATSDLPLTHFRDKEGALGNLLADVLREAAHSDFSMVNSGGIRTPLDAGPVTYDGIFRVLPFDNLLNVVKVNGKQLKLMYQIATAGSHGIVGFSGLRLTLIPYTREVEKVDLNHDGKLENWEGKRLVKIETSDGKPIEDKRMYTVATFDFLVNGGDDMHWFMSQIPKKNINKKTAAYARDLVVDYLKKVKHFNTAEHPLVDPKNPRVIFTD